MLSQRDIGGIAEQIAKDHLQKSGMQVIETNWYHGHLELDIIARDGNELVIVEVKTRCSAFFGEPYLFVSQQKQKALIRAANAYIKYKKLSMNTRFDIISIIINTHKRELRHIKDAFYPSL